MLWLSPAKQAKCRKKKKAVRFRDEGDGKKREKVAVAKSKNYPNCTKDSLLRAFEKANLPDFDAIAEHELNITVERPGRKRGTPVPTPPLSQLLEVFEETDQSLASVPVRLTRSSQKRIVASPLNLISMQQDRFRRRRKHAELIEPILLSPDWDASISLAKDSIPSSSDPPTMRQVISSSAEHEPRPRNNHTMLESRCSGQDVAPSPTFAVPAVPALPIGMYRNERTFIEPHTLREDSFAQNFGAGLTSTPLTARKRGFLRPHTKPLLQSASLIYRPASAEPLQLRSSFAYSTGLKSLRNSSLVRSQLQSAGKVCRVISCRHSDLNETVVADREELRDTLVTSFATAFSTAKIMTENGDHQLLTPRDKVLALCSPQAITSFSTLFAPDLMHDIHKIGEGSFGEIFLSKTPDGIEIVCKLVPFNVHDDEEVVFSQILPEVMILSTFNRLRESSLNQTSNFISMSRAAILKGSFPQKLLHEWDEFDRLKQSENPDPRIYKKDHLHLLMILNNGGVDLEHFKLKSAEQGLGIFMQTAFSLAAAESEFEFEHRDLHWGNVLVKNTDAESMDYVVTGCPYEVPSGKVEVSIIDFTLSRISKDGYTVYDDLSKYSDLFTGDALVDYQFEVYRLMEKENGGDWGQFCPRSNIFWLNYLLDKLLNNKKYTSRSKTHQKAVESLRKLRKNMLGFASSKDFIESSFMNEMLISWR